MTGLRDVADMSEDELDAEKERRRAEREKDRELASTTDESVLRKEADKLLGQHCPPLTKVEMILSDPPSLRLTFVGGTVVNLPERLLNRPTELVTTIAVKVRRAITLKRGAFPHLLDYLLRAAIDVPVDAEATDRGYIEMIIAKYLQYKDTIAASAADAANEKQINQALPGLLEDSDRIPPFMHGGALHLHAPSLRLWWNKTHFGDEVVSPQRLAYLMRTTDWTHVTVDEAIGPEADGDEAIALGANGTEADGDEAKAAKRLQIRCWRQKT